MSIHATDPDVRTRLLRNRRGATSLRWLDALLDAGVEVHGQIVVCPGVNDGAVLDDTLLGILDRFPDLATVGAVPLGVSGHSDEPEMRPHTTAEAEAVLDTIDAWQDRYLAALGRRMIFAADEYYLMADRPFPGAAEYEGFAQHENGIGMARTFAAEVDAALAGHAVEGVGTARRVLRVGRRRAGGGLPRAADAPDATRRARRARDGRPDRAPHRGVRRPGARAAPAPRSATLAGVEVRLHPVPNRFFGGNIAVTGLHDRRGRRCGARRAARRRPRAAARRRAVAGPVPRRRARRRPAATGRGRRHRRRFAGRGACGPTAVAA